MKRQVSFYDPSTGALTGRTFIGPDSAVEANTPAGLAAIDGIHDHLSRRVNIATGEIEDWQPPQPDSDHEWNAAARRWQLTATAATREQKRERAAGKIDDLERKQLRALRELALDPTNDTAKRFLQSIEDQIAAARPDLTP